MGELVGTCCCWRSGDQAPGLVEAEDGAVIFLDDRSSAAADFETFSGSLSGTFSMSCGSSRSQSGRNVYRSCCIGRAFRHCEFASVPAILH